MCLRDQIQVLTTFVLAVAHECLLHGLGRLNSILFLDGDGVSCRDDGFCDDLQCFDDAYVAELLRDVQSGLPVLCENISWLPVCSVLLTNLEFSFGKELAIR